MLLTMSSKPSTSLRGIAAVLALLAACDSEVNPEGGGGEGGEGGQGGDGASGGEGGQGGEGAAGGQGGEGGTGGVGPITCEATQGDVEDGCLVAGCAVVVDTDFTCDDFEVAAPGVRVAATEEATFLVTATSNAAVVYRVIGGEASRIDDGLPSSYVRSTFSAATDSEGNLHLGVDATIPGVDYDGGAEHAVFDGVSWSRSVVHDREDKYVPMLNLEIGAGDLASLWISDDAPDTCVIAQEDEGGAITTVNAPTLQGAYGRRWFSLATDERVVAFDMRDDVLRTLIDGQETSLGGASVAAEYLVAHAPAPFEGAAGPAYAALLARQQGLSVVWPDGAGGWDEAVVPGSGRPTLSCPDLSDGPECTGDCVETSTRVERDSFAIGRTTDGKLWVAFVSSAYDIALHYEEDCQEEIGCFCNKIVDDDQSTYTLHLVSIDPESGTAEEVYRGSTERLGVDDLFLGSYSYPRALDVRGYGTSLAIGVRTAGASFGEAAVRLLRIETGP